MSEDVEEVEGWRDAIKAVRGNDLEKTTALLSKHPNLAKRVYGGSLLHRAANASKPETLDLLIQLGCEVDAEEDDDSYPRTPLGVAASRDNVAAVTVLLKHGANPNHEPSRCLIAAVTGENLNSLEIVKLLESHGADLHKIFPWGPNDNPINALSMAETWSKPDVAEYLRSRGCVLPGEATPEPFGHSNSGKSQVDDEIVNQAINAVFNNDLESIKHLLTTHSHLAKRNQGGTLLHDAANSSAPETIQLLSQLGCDIDAEYDDESDPQTPLGIACARDNVAGVKCLLEKGANPNHEPSRCSISAIVGEHSHSLEIIKLLESHGADLHKIFPWGPNDDPINALSMAETWSKPDVAQYLRSRGCVLPGENPKPPQPAKPEKSLTAEVQAYLSAKFGAVDKLAMKEIVATQYPITVNFIPASDKCKSVTLFTTGMSSHALSVPPQARQFARAEILIQLPANWQYKSIKDPVWNWPHLWLRKIAQYPLENDTWLAGPYCILPSGNPPTPIAPATRFTHLLLIAEMPLAWTNSQVGPMQFYRMLPLYPEEAALEETSGISALLRGFDLAKIGFEVDLKRKNVGVI